MSAVSSEVAADREAFASVAGTLDANVGDIVAQFLNAKSEYDAKFTEPPAEVYAQHAQERVERKSKRGTERTSLGEGGYKGAWISEYRSSSDKGRQAKSAVKNSRSDIRRRYLSLPQMLRPQPHRRRQSGTSTRLSSSRLRSGPMMPAPPHQNRRMMMPHLLLLPLVPQSGRAWAIPLEAASILQATKNQITCSQQKRPPLQLQMRQSH